MAIVAVTSGTLDGQLDSKSPEVAALENLQGQSYNAKSKIDATQPKQIRRT